MKQLEDKILSDGIVAEGDVLKVGSFLNQQIDVELSAAMADEFYRLFGESNVTKIVTVEASGIGLACLAAERFRCPVVFAKKSKSTNISGEVFTAQAFSYTHRNLNTLVIPRDFLSPGDRILIIDDFLASGNAVNALTDIVRQVGAALVGVGIAVEKVYQGGGDQLRAQGIPVHSLAMIESMSVENGVVFVTDRE